MARDGVISGALATTIAEALPLLIVVGIVIYGAYKLHDLFPGIGEKKNDPAAANAPAPNASKFGETPGAQWLDGAVKFWGGLFGFSNQSTAADAPVPESDVQGAEEVGLASPPLSADLGADGYSSYFNGPA